MVEGFYSTSNSISPKKERGHYASAGYNTYMIIFPQLFDYEPNT